MYNESQKKCVNRKIIYFSKNDKKLMATNTTSISDYEKEK